MKILNNIDQGKARELLIGILGINITFIVSGLLYETLTKLPFINIQTSQQEYYRSAVGFNVLQKGISWLLAALYNGFTLSSAQKVHIPHKNAALCGFTIFIGSITFVQSIYLVSFPFINMAKSFNILGVILVGVLCSRVKSKKLKLGPKKIITAIVVSFGILMFRFFDPEAQMESQKQTQIQGIIILFISIMADGFLPDFQAEIKEKFKPKQTQMLLQISKWSFIWCLLYAIATNQLFYTIQFCRRHPLFTIQIILFSLLTFVGQIFVYRLISQFQQHIVPFVVTTRKILTVGLSLVYFNHQTSIGQFFGIITVFFVTSYQFFSSILKTNSQQKNKGSYQNPNIPVQTQYQKTNSQMEQNQHIKKGRSQIEKSQTNLNTTQINDDEKQILQEIVIENDLNQTQNSNLGIDLIQTSEKVAVK